MRRSSLVLAASAIATALTGVACQDMYTRVGKARLVEADGTVPAAEGPVYEVPGGALPAQASGPVRIAADRDVPYSEVLAAAAQVQAAGGQPIFLVAKHRRVAALPPAAPVAEGAIRLETNINMRACVSPPGVKEKKCVARPDGKHIDRAFVRELLREAVAAYGIQRVHVVIPATYSWADAVRAVDAARTCCGTQTIEVSVEAM